MPLSSAGYRYRCAMTATLALVIFSSGDHLTSGEGRPITGRSAVVEETADPTDQADAEPLLLAARPRNLRRRNQPSSTGSPKRVERPTRVKVVARGKSSRAARRAGMAALPLQKLTPENRRRVQALLESVSIFRELPTLSFEVRPSVYQYFLTHPDAAVSIWRAMEISQFQMWQTGAENYEADAGDGTVGIIDVLYRSRDESLVICNGEYQSPILARPIKANALMHLQAEFREGANGKIIATHHLKLFVDFPSTTVEMAARIVSPLSNMIVDRNFHEVSMFLHMMSTAMARRPDWVEHIVAKMDGVLEPSKNELVDLTTRVHFSAVKRTADGTTKSSPSTSPMAIGTSAAVVAPQPVSSKPPRVVSTPRPAVLQ